jgi:glycosyltransferase involved in cell wall biosynthesis
MKIAIDITPSIFQGSGIASYYNHLIPQLLKQGSNHEFILFGYSLRKRNQLKLANKIFPFPPKLMEIIWNKMHILPVELLVGDCQVIHTWDYIQAPTKNAAVVTTIHDLTPIKFPSYQHPRTISSYKSGLHWIEREKSTVITDSESTKNDILSNSKIPKDRIHVIYLAAGEEFKNFRTKKENIKKSSLEKVKEKYDIQSEYLLSVGTQEPRKNLRRIIEAFRTLNSNYSLVIAGKYGWGETIKPARGVKSVSYVSEKDLPPLYAGATCLIYPSLYEGFGLPVVEAMAIGCPVVTSDRGSLKEIAGDAAVIVNPEDVSSIASGVKSAIRNRDQLVNKGLAQANKFSWEKTASQTLEVYESLEK